MPRPTARVLALLELLQAGGTRTAAELAERLEVDERTVRRYADHLLELEVPVETVRGRYGGFRIAAGSRLPPLMLTDEEAVAVALGLGGVARTGPSTAVRTAAETAAAKLVRVLPGRLAARVPGVADVRSTARSHPAPEASADAITTATTAAREHRPLRIRHRRGGTTTTRTLLPWGVVEHEGRWYVTGLDSASDAVRTFRMDRLEHVEIGTGRFEPPPDADPVREVLAALAGTPRDFSVRVLVRASEDRIRRTLPASVAVLEPAPEEEGWVRVLLEAARLDWVAGALALLDAPFRIERPAALRDEVLRLADRLRARAADPD
ncbi:helix-turn-helix transcriptional regulator [Amnibacterium kyonggiense]|uniref:Putative DNA-binding transcriptional regulator YafY n=1 Tax=Amnibacterium kyonggiense TaxID=595671 RepID=A0A4R7FSI0_9MICO|nr:WYL domain-containing protein [Amnibacterium kyonggiense]TDS80619.1 putative DNA-binding transcriptional regulator YafY [Amnibacterium kyonggiense]